MLTTSLNLQRSYVENTLDFAAWLTITIFNATMPPAGIHKLKRLQNRVLFMSIFLSQQQQSQNPTSYSHF